MDAAISGTLVLREIFMAARIKASSFALAFAALSAIPAAAQTPPHKLTEREQCTLQVYADFFGTGPLRYKNAVTENFPGGVYLLVNQQGERELLGKKDETVALTRGLVFADAGGDITVVYRRPLTNDFHVEATHVVAPNHHLTRTLDYEARTLKSVVRETRPGAPEEASLFFNNRGFTRALGKYDIAAKPAGFPAIREHQRFHRKLLKDCGKT